MKALGIVIGATSLPLLCCSGRNHRFRVSFSSSSSGSKTVCIFILIPATKFASDNSRFAYS